MGGVTSERGGGRGEQDLEMGEGGQEFAKISDLCHDDGLMCCRLMSVFKDCIAFEFIVRLISFLSNFHLQALNIHMS